MKWKSQSINAILVFGLLLYLVFISVFSYLHGWQWLDSDHSSEMVLGKILAQENTFVSSNWLYSTEIRLIYQTIFTMPLFKLLGSYENWALIRSINIFLNNLVLIFSYIFLMKQLKINFRWILISAFFLIIPLSYDYWTFLLFGGYYTFFIAQLFICLGLFIRIVDNAAGKEKPDLITGSFILYSILSLALGVQSIRSLLNIHVPLLLACIYIWTKQKRHFPLFLGFYGFVLCVLGYAGNYFLRFIYSFHSYETMRIENLYVDFFLKISRSFANIAGFFGLSVGIPFISVQGLFSMAAIFAGLVFIWAVYRACRNKSSLQEEKRFLPVFFAASATFNIFIFIVVDQVIIGRYFIPFMILYIPLAAMLFDHSEKMFTRLKRTVIIPSILLFIAGQGFLNFHKLVIMDINSIRKPYIQYLLDNNLEYGFAQFWNANITTELSNGRIQMAGCEFARFRSDSRMFRLQEFLNHVKVFDSSYYEGESFLLLSHSEWERFGRDRTLNGLEPDFQDNDFVVFRFPSARIIYREFLGIH